MSEGLSINDIDSVLQNLKDFQTSLKHKGFLGAKGQNVCLDRFDIVKLVGVGGYSKVYQCRDKVTGRQLILKIVRKALLLHRQSINHLKREISILSGIHHSYNLLTQIYSQPPLQFPRQPKSVHVAGLYERRRSSERNKRSQNLH